MGDIKNIDGEYRMKPKVKALIVVGILLLMVLTTLSVTWINVPAGHKAVVVSGVNIGKTFDEGIHLKNPLDKVEMIRYNTQEISFVGSDSASDTKGSIMAITEDNVEVFLDMTVVFHIVKDKVSVLRIENGADWKGVIVLPILRSIPRDISAHYTVFEIAGIMRANLGISIEENITVALAEKHLVVESFSLRDVRLPNSILNSINAKMVAEQQVLEAINHLEQAVIDVQQNIVKAEAEYNVTIIRASAQQEAIRIVMEQFATEYDYIVSGNGSNATLTPSTDNSTREDMINYYMMWLYINALSDPNSNIQYIMLPSEGGTPVILDLSATSGNSTASA